MEYRGSKLGFHLVKGKNLDDVTKVFRKTKRDEREKMITEVRKPDVGPLSRGRGTVQAARYDLKLVSDELRTSKLFVVVTRLVPTWAKRLVEMERYALAVALEDRSGNDVQLYAQTELMIRQRVRQRG